MPNTEDKIISSTKSEGFHRILIIISYYSLNFIKKKTVIDVYSATRTNFTFVFLTIEILI